MPEERSGAAILVESLVRQGVEFVFGYPGGAVLPIYDELFADQRIRHILVRHEAGAAHAAEGYARSTGKPGVVLVTSGPGATNAITGIADAFMDSIPLVVITGQVATNLIGTDAFQEADTVGLTRHCTKHNYLVKDPAELAATIDEAFEIATTGRPGPVVVDIPKNVQVATAALADAPAAAPAALSPAHGRRARRDRRGDRADRQGRAADLLHRRRRDQFRPARERAAARAAGADRRAGHLDADGPRRLPGRPSRLARHARHARHLRSQPGDEPVRPDGEHRRALRRPGDRPARRVLARLDQDPHRYRPLARSTRSSRSTSASSATARRCSSS